MTIVNHFNTYATTSLRLNKNASMMQRTYLLLTIAGTALPNIFVLRESLSSGNIMLYARPLETFSNMFANNVSSAFAIDLLFVVLLFLVWTLRETRTHRLKHLGWVWLYTFALGLAGGLPLFLYLRHKQLSSSTYPSDP